MSLKNPNGQGCLYSSRSVIGEKEKVMHVALFPSTSTYRSQTFFGTYRNFFCQGLGICQRRWRCCRNTGESSQHLAGFVVRGPRPTMPEYWVRRVEKRPEIFHMQVERARCYPQSVGAKVPVVLGRKEKECVKQCKITDQLLVQMIVLRPTHTSKYSSGNGYFERKSMRCSS